MTLHIRSLGASEWAIDQLFPVTFNVPIFWNLLFVSNVATSSAYENINKSMVAMVTWHGAPRVYSRSSRYVAERTWVPLAVAAEVSFFLALVLLNEAINLVNTIIQLQGKSFNMKYQHLRLFLSVSFASSIHHGGCWIMSRRNLFVEFF